MALVLALRGTARARRMLSTHHLGRKTSASHIQQTSEAAFPFEFALEDLVAMLLAHVLVPPFEFALKGGVSGRIQSPAPASQALARAWALVLAEAWHLPDFFLGAKVRGVAPRRCSHDQIWTFRTSLRVSGSYFSMSECCLRSRQNWSLLRDDFKEVFLCLAQ